MNSLDILDEGYNKPSIVIDEAKLSIDYLPQNLPFREEHLKALSRNFRGILTGQMTSTRTIITGPVGVGKTSIAKKFGLWTESRSKNNSYGRKLKYIHINCRRTKTPFMILLSIAKELNGHIGTRGYAADELLEMIIELLELDSTTLILVLDEIEYIIPKGGIDLLYALSRTGDDRHNPQHQIALILIGKSTQFLSFLDQSTKSSLTAPIISVAPYTQKEIEVILSDRVTDCFLPGAVATDSITLIADIAAKRGGDARHAIELLLIAGKYADLDSETTVYPEHVRKAKANVDPSLLKETLGELSIHKLLLLLGIIQTLYQTKKAYITTGIAKNAYYMLAEEYEVQPRKHTQIWEYLQELELIGIIHTEKSGQGQRGNTQNISILDTSVQELKKEVIPRLKEIILKHKK